MPKLPLWLRKSINMKIIKGDKVLLTIGKDKGRSGEVLVVFPKINRVVVKGLNIFKKHVKAQKGQKGGIIEKERALDASKVMILCPNCQKPSRIAYELDKSGAKHRLCKKCHQLLDSKSSK